MTALDRLLAAERPFLTDGGLETDLIYHDQFELPQFAAFPLLDTVGGRAALTRYFNRFLDLAEAEGRGFLIDTPTWRANMGWAPKMGFGADDVRSINRRAVEFARDLRRQRSWAKHILINGAIGPAGDGYAPDMQLTPDQASALHAPQLGAFAEAGVDLATAFTMTHVGEAVGVARRAQSLGLPIVLSFTVETDGRLPVGGSLADAIAAVDDATSGAPLYYGINCAHPTHFAAVLDGDFRDRIGVVRANASHMSHAELDVATELDDGDPAEFGPLYADLVRLLPNLRVIGGCCGTDTRHVAAMVRG